MGIPIKSLIKVNLKTLLFENRGVRQTVFKNTLWLTIAEGITRLLSLVLIIYTARILGATGYGKFTFALSFVSIIVIFADLGLSNITTRELSRAREGEKDYSAILALKVVLSGIALAVMVVGSFLITEDPVIQRAIWLLAIFILISNFFSILYAFFRARQKMEYEAGAKILQALATTGIGFLILLTLPSVGNLSAGYLLANLITLALLLPFFHLRFQAVRLRWSRAVSKRFLRISWPLSLGFLFGGIHLFVDSAMMGYFGEITQTGWYNAAGKIALATIVAATLIAKSFYPVLSRFFKESRERLQRAWQYQMELMVILALPLMIGGLVLAPRIIDFFYGSGYSPSIFAFQLLIVVAGLSFLYYPLSMILVVADHEKKNFSLILGGGVINILLNLILIPQYSLYGAAIATIIAALIIFLAALILSGRLTPISPFNGRLLQVLILASLASLIMFAVLKQPSIYQLNVFLATLSGSLVYLISFLGGRKLVRQLSPLTFKSR